MVSNSLPLVQAYADGWTALGDPTRRAIFERLVATPLAVGEIARDLPVSRPAVSQHLKVLKDAGLVTDRAAGTRRIYRVDPAGIASLRAELDRFWTQALTNFKDIVEHPAEEAP
jgi:DNA-binding transcriptional ArsR family regulator